MRWLTLIILLPIGFAEAASFDCSKATSYTESTICADTDLSSKDEALANTFRAVLKRVPSYQEQLLKEQRQWLKTRDSCRTSDCIRETYEIRLKMLKSIATFTEHEADIAYDCTEALDNLIGVEPNTLKISNLDLELTTSQFEKFCPRFGFRVPLNSKANEFNKKRSRELRKLVKEDGHSGPSYQRIYYEFGRNPNLFFNAY